MRPWDVLVISFYFARVPQLEHIYSRCAFVLMAESKDNTDIQGFNASQCLCRFLLPLNGAPADIGPVKAFRPVDFFNYLVSPALRICDAHAEGCYIENPAANGLEPFRVAFGAGVKNPAAGPVKTIHAIQREQETA